METAPGGASQTVVVPAEVIFCAGVVFPAGVVFLQLLVDRLSWEKPVLGWATYRGMDRLWPRIRSEGILKDFQQVRVLKMVE